MSYRAFFNGSRNLGNVGLGGLVVDHNGNLVDHVAVSDIFTGANEKAAGLLAFKALYTKVRDLKLSKVDYFCHLPSVVQTLGNFHDGFGVGSFYFDLFATIPDEDRLRVYVIQKKKNYNSIFLSHAALHLNGRLSDVVEKYMDSRRYKAFFDGSSTIEGINSKSCLGYAILDEKLKIIKQSSKVIKGQLSAGDAELWALNELLRELHALQIDSVTIFGDSQGTIRQVLNKTLVGIYSNNPLSPMNEILENLSYLKEWHLEWVPRSLNYVADRMSKSYK